MDPVVATPEKAVKKRKILRKLIKMKGKKNTKHSFYKY